MKIPPVLAQLFLCALMTMLWTGDLQAQQTEPDRCRTRKLEDISPEEMRRINETHRNQGYARIEYPPPPAKPWNPQEEDGYFISDQGRTHPGLASWRYRHYTPCPQKRADDQMREYGGHTEGIFHTLAPQSVLGPDRNGERVIQAALEIGKTITDMGYEFDGIFFTIHVVDDRVWNSFQNQFRELLAKGSPEDWADIEECKQRLVVEYGDYVPSRCIQFTYYRTKHLATPGGKIADFIGVYTISNDAFAKSLKDECTASADTSRLCKSILTAKRGGKL
ncbi:hypothetical protein ACFSM5_15740 [Lacibacterium aquatile]|uniref:Uncharacterized protein n=1 Tax=Lacibacterium aquatile TaxID=1168082 RepID=A0ABW5DV65_9PROT